MLINWVVVLGDFGRSPRMQFHAQSLASKPDSIVHVIAYGGSTPLSSLISAPNVHIHNLPEVPHAISRLPGILKLVLKVLHQLLAMLWIMLWKLPAPSNILMQNPPCIPTMVLCWWVIDEGWLRLRPWTQLDSALSSWKEKERPDHHGIRLLDVLTCRIAAKRHGAKMVIDWHNFGYSIMALKRPEQSLIVRLARAHEAAWGRRADKNFCVTRAMQQELAGPRWGVAAKVLYDRPPKHFSRTDVAAAHELLVRLAGVLASGPSGTRSRAAAADGAGGPERSAEQDFATEDASSGWGPDKTIMTVRSGAQKGVATWRSDRPAVLVSSTSWTPDEDFGVLLEALVRYETEAEAQKQGRRSSSGTLPGLLVLITGRWVCYPLFILGQGVKNDAPSTLLE